MTILNLNDLTQDGRVHNLTGRDLGRRARENMHIAELDASDQTIEVQIPEHVFLITPSFFIGMFAASVAGLGSVDAFFEKYEFTSPPQVLRQIQDAARRALIVSTPQT